MAKLKKTGMFDLSGKVAIITGGNGGIGFGIAMELANAGASVVIAARNTSKSKEAVLKLTSMGATALSAELDATDENSVESVVNMAANKFGKIDVLVNNAGTNIRKFPEEFSKDEWEKVLGTNLTSMFLCSREVHPHMVQGGGGKIINIGSMTSIFGIDWGAPYGASKGGVVQYTKSLAVAWAKDNIQANTILPGWIHTDLTSKIKTDHPERYSSITSRIPAGRWGEPPELGGTAVFLSSSASNYITGAVIPVDGGYASF